MAVNPRLLLTHDLVFVTVAPEITYDDQYKVKQSLKADGVLTLYVTISGVPKPTVAWSHDGTTLVSTNGTTVETAQGYSRLCVKHLTIAEAGTYTVTAENCAGKAAAEFEVAIKDRPSPPLNVRPTGTGKDFVIVNWDRPESDGGSPITGYVVERRDVKRETVIKCEEVKDNVFSLKVGKLVDGNQYIFQVRAINDVGESEPTATEPVTAKLPFGEWSIFIVHLFEYTTPGEVQEIFDRTQWPNR